MATNFIAPAKLFLFILYCHHIVRFKAYGLQELNSQPTNYTISASLAQLSLSEASYHLKTSTDRLAIFSKLTSPNSTGSGLNILSLLMLCGDISVNPGPNWNYPCGVCLKPVKRNQKGIQCDSCDSWYHTRCCSVRDETYCDLANSSCTWICCTCGLPNFSNSLFDTFEISVDNYFNPLTSPLASTGISINPPISPQQASSPLRPKAKSRENKSNRKLKAMIINCNGLKGPSRFTEFQALLDLHKPDIILGTESKLHSDIPTYSVFPPNYTVYRRDRDAFGGGVFQAIKSDIVCEECPKFNNNCEILWSSVKFSNSKKLFLASFYRPPSSSAEVLIQLQESINNVFETTTQHPNIIVGGDFNLGDINWDLDQPQLSNHANTAQHDMLLRILDDYSLKQHVMMPTRPASNKTLDLLLSSYPNNISNVSTTTGISDHLAVTFNINTKASRSFKRPHKVYIYKKANFPSFCEYMSHAADDFFLSNPQDKSVAEIWNSFKSTLIEGIQCYIPQRTSLPKYKLPWINTNIKRHMRKKDRLHKKACSSHNPNHWEAFKKERNQVSHLVKQAHSSYLNDVIGGSLVENPKKFWSYIRTSKTESIGIPPLKTTNTLCVSDKAKADALNSHFFSVFTKEQSPIPSKGPSPYMSIPGLIISPNGVAKQLSILNPSKACGPDELTARVLKELAPSIAPWLCFIFQQSYDNAILPPDWSKALVSAVYKKDAKSDPANYRPISLTCLCCKVMEHIILSHVAKHLSDHDILIDQQHGFRKLFSCETQLISAINDWAKCIDHQKQSDAILLDFSKAFDSVPHARLLSKLNYYGIRGPVANWIEAFLSNRSQVVSVNGTHSDSRPVISGVPQGTILAPVLFLLYINDISDGISSHIRLFADDSIIYREINDYQDHITLQEDLDKLNNWANTWQLNFNFSKCYHLGISNKKIPTTFTYVMGGKSISRVNSTKYLGINISSNLNWNLHCDAICKKANSSLGLLRRILSECTADVKSKAYTSLVRPQVEYASSAWNPYTKRNINKIEMIQRRAARFVANDFSRYSSVSAMIEQLGWVSLEQRRSLSQASMFYKIHNGLVGIPFPQEVTPLTRTSRLPNFSPFHQLQCSTNVYKYSFFPRSIVIWNNIPLSNSTCTSNISSFKFIALPTLEAFCLSEC